MFPWYPQFSWIDLYSLPLYCFLYFFFFYFFNFIFKLYIIVLVLPNIKMNLPQVYMCSTFLSLLASMCRGAKFATPKCVFRVRINLGWWFSRNRRLKNSSFYLSFNCLKNLNKVPDPRIELLPEIPRRNMGWCSGRVWRSESTLCSIVSSWPSKHLFTKHLLFHLYVKCLPSLWSRKPLPPISSFYPILSEDGI